jgi:pilus assembly protein Flp/PilA
LGRFLRDERAATAIEYGLIAALIAVLAIGGMTAFGGGLSGLFGSVSNRSTNAMSGG